MSAILCGRVAGTVFLPSPFELSHLFLVLFNLVVFCLPLDLLKSDLVFGVGFGYDDFGKSGGVFEG